jgi:hypothetical protein
MWERRPRRDQPTLTTAQRPEGKAPRKNTPPVGAATRRDEFLQTRTHRPEGGAPTHQII